MTATTADLLSIEHVRRNLSTEGLGHHIYLFTTLPSANATLRHLARDGVAHGTVVLAETQSDARSGTGATWYSPSGLNLYLAVVLRPRLAAHEVPTFAAIPALALVDALLAEGVRARPRWPNEVVVDGRKIGATSAEFGTLGERVDYVILGIDVNLNVDRAALERALGAHADGATSTREETGRTLDRNRFAATVLNLLEKWLLTWNTCGREAVLAARRQLETSGV